MAKELEKKYQKENNKWDLFFEGSSDAIFIADLKSRKITDCNPAGEDLLGYSKEELIGETIEILHPKEVLNKIREGFKKQAKGEIKSLESLVLTKKGNKIPVNINTAILKSNNKAEIVGIFRDISEFDDIRNKFKFIFNEVNDAVYFHTLAGKDVRGSFLDVNKTAVERMGYSKEEFLKMGVSEIDDPEVAKKVLPEVAEELKNKGKAIFEMVHVAKNGDKIPVEISSKIINYQENKAVISIARNIQVRKKLEEDLKEKIEEMEKINKSMIGRELKMIELKEEIKNLKNDKL